MLGFSRCTFKKGSFVHMHTLYLYMCNSRGQWWQEAPPTFSEGTCRYVEDSRGATAKAEGQTVQF